MSFAERRATNAGEDSSSTPVLPGVKKPEPKVKIGPVHIVQCREPIQMGQCVLTICELTIADAIPVPFADGDFQIVLADLQKLKGVCRACVSRPEVLTGEHLLYGVRSRKEIRQENQQEKKGE